MLNPDCELCGETAHDICECADCLEVCELGRWLCFECANDIFIEENEDALY